MVFMGLSFTSGPFSLDPTPTNVSSIESTIIKNGIFDELYITSDNDSAYSTTIPSEWGIDTILHALFDGDLFGGNIGLILGETSKIRIKRRKVNTYDWISLYEFDISSANDLNFDFFDRYAKSNTEYEYYIVPVMDEVEGNPAATGTILSEFNGIFILDKETIFGTILNTKQSDIQRNIKTSVVETLGRQYPFTIQNGDVNYDSSQTTGFFVELDTETCGYKIAEGYDYRKLLNDFLSNGMPKILKYDDSRMWLINITTPPAEMGAGHKDLIETTFGWVEAGNCESTNDLYDNNFIDINIEHS